MRFVPMAFQHGALIRHHRILAAGLLIIIVNDENSHQTIDLSPLRNRARKQRHARGVTQGAYNILD
jgi:hypothetical protein